MAQACFAIHLMEATMNIDNMTIYRVLNFGAITTRNCPLI